MGLCPKVVKTCDNPFSAFASNSIRLCATDGWAKPLRVKYVDSIAKLVSPVTVNTVMYINYNIVSQNGLTCGSCPRTTIIQLKKQS